MASIHETQGGGQERTTIGFFSAQSEIGGRNYQEDRYVAETLRMPDRSLQLLAVMDGHLGAGTAQLVADSLAAIVRKSYKPDDIEHTLATSVASLHEMTKNSSSGSTLSVAVIPEDEPRAHVAILGDSPVMIFDGNGGINMSPSHNSRDNPKELEEAIKRGAKPQRGYIGADGSRELLQITRALGDRELGSVLSREPDIYSADITEDSVVMVSSDGVLGSGQKDNQRAIAYLENLLTVEKIDAEELVRDASRRGSKDNATAIIWRAKKD